MLQTHKNKVLKIIFYLGFTLGRVHFKEGGGRVLGETDGNGEVGQIDLSSHPGVAMMG